MQTPTISAPRRPSIPTAVRNAGSTATAERATATEMARGADAPSTLAGTAQPVFADAPNASGTPRGVRTATVERPAIHTSESGLNLSNPERVNHQNGLNLIGVCQDATANYNYAVGHTQFLYREYSDHQVIAYAGSKDLKDWAHDANVVKKQYKDMGWVHTGFADAYDEIVKLQNTLVKKDKPVIVSGHSLGGATATVAALDMKQRGYNVHSVYTYGAPRVGYSDFKDIYEEAGIPTYRYINAWDVVPRIPKINYHHVGQPFYLSTSGKMLDKQESAWKLWPWQIPGQRISSHHLTNYKANMQKFLS